MLKKKMALFLVDNNILYVNLVENNILYFKIRKVFSQVECGSTNTVFPLDSDCFKCSFRHNLIAYLEVSSPPTPLQYFGFNFAVGYISSPLYFKTVPTLTLELSH